MRPLLPPALPRRWVPSRKPCAFLLAGLDAAARATIELQQARAAATSDIGSLAGAVPPLVSILRYGTARDMPAAELRLLVTSLTQSVAAGLVYACRNLQWAEAQGPRETLAAIAAMGCPVFACTLDHFPELMAAALKRADLWAWAAANDIALVRAGAAAG